ncbi:protein FD-like [Momordica charantia]|uniref:Protein FD-like n=1 Tax=Momordica charantia TaxID=3673 RepID=A0A6J1CVX1_MOMCH|nr:protein FD-like [Momordica charantia]
MEEVWKDITLSSLHSRSDQDFSAAATPISLHLHHHHASSASNFRGIILQDFLSSSTSKNDSSAAAAATAAAAPPTVLTLNSAGELHFPDNVNPAAHFRPHCHPMIPSSFHGPFDQVLGPPPFAKKRVPDSDCHANSGDRRQKRMIKNRESAARSRARKQAYTNELELEVAHLMEENAKLRRQQEELRAAAAAQVPRKHRLQRTSTAPF